MYIPEKIKALSNAQINKMLSGLPVRVQKGVDHLINMSVEQSKKLNKSAMSGKGFTIRLDPYQVVQHRNLMGQGFASNMLKSASSMAKSAAKKAGKQLAQKGLQMAQNYAQNAIDSHLSGEGFGDLMKSASRMAKNTAQSAGKQLAKKSLNLAHKAVSDALPTVASKLGAIAGHPELGAMLEPFAQMGADAALGAVKAKTGLGMKKRGPGRPRKPGRPKSKKVPKRKKVSGSALRPAGY
jgi:hypothetical protein